MQVLRLEPLLCLNLKLNMNDEQESICAIIFLGLYDLLQVNLMVKKGILLATWYDGTISIPQLSSRNCLHCVVMKSPANGDFTIACNLKR